MKGMILLVLVLIATVYENTIAQTRLKELVHLANSENVKLIGYGIVVGLDGTGDSRSSNFTINSIANMLSKFGIEVNQKQLRTRNAAAVMVTAEVNPFTAEGAKFDVTVSSIGDAKSLKGGILLATPLTLNGEQVFAIAQGPVFVGGREYGTRDFGYLRYNHTLAARIPNGAVLLKTFSKALFGIKDSIVLYLNKPDFTNAVRAAKEINNYFKSDLARIEGPSTIIVKVPDSLRSKNGIAQMLAEIEQIPIQTDIENKIVINERTGTIVAGQNVRIKPVAIAHENLEITIEPQDVVNRKMINVAQGDINVTPQITNTGKVLITDSLLVNVSGGNINVNPTQFNNSVPAQNNNKTVVLPETTTIQDLANALNSLGVRPRDLITIIQLLKNAGAINAEIEIM